MKKKILLLTTLLAANYQLASSEGVLGKNYWGLSYETADVANVDIWGVTAHYNRNLFTDTDYSYDLNVQLSHAELDQFSIDVEATGVEASIVIFSATEKELTPFLGLSAGYGEGSILGNDDGSFKYQVSVGGEWKASERFTITPYAKYFNYTSIPDGDDFEVGIDLNLWVTEEVSVGLDYSNISASGTNLDVFSAFFRKKF